MGLQNQENQIKILPIFVQVKLNKKIEVKDAFLRVDPEKFYQNNCGLTGGITSGKAKKSEESEKIEHVIKTYEEGLKSFLAKLKDIPCIRMVFSGASEKLKGWSELVDRGSVKDLKIFVGDDDLNSILGEELSNIIRRLKEGSVKSAKS